MPSLSLRPVPRSPRSAPCARAILALILREMTTTYGRSPGGYLWTVIEPVAGIAFLTAIFSLVLRAPSLGVNFPIFYASGMLPFLLFTSTNGKLAHSLRFSKQLLAYPAVTFIDAILARFFLSIGTNAIVAYLIIGTILWGFDTRLVPDFGIIVEGFALAVGLALGVGTLNAYLFTRFEMWQNIWSILTRPLFIASGIFFIFETIPAPYANILWFNPLIHVVGIVRRGFYAGYDAPYASALYVGAVSMGCFLLGLFLLYRHHRDLLEAI